MADTKLSLDDVLNKSFLLKWLQPKVDGEASTTTTDSTLGNAAGNYAAGIASKVLDGINPFTIAGNSLLNSNRGRDKALGLTLNSVGRQLGTSVAKGIGTGVAKNVGESLAKEGLKGAASNVGQNVLSGAASGALSGLKSGVANLASPSAIANIGLGVADAMLGQKSEYSGDKGGVTKGLDKAYGVIETGVLFIPGIGQGISLGMKAAKVAGKALGKVGGGTDAMTTGDAVLGSDFFSWNIGAINGFGGARAHSYFSNNDLNAQMGSGYNNFQAYDSEAAHYGGKKYGLISGGARNKANRIIDEARRLLNIIGNVVDYNTLNTLGAQGSTPFLANRYSNDLSGGIQQMLAAKHGMKISRNDMFTLELINNTKRLISEYKIGGYIAKHCKECSKEVVKGDGGLSLDDPRVKKLQERLNLHKSGEKPLKSVVLPSVNVSIVPNIIEDEQYLKPNTKPIPNPTLQESKTRHIPSFTSEVFEDPENTEWTRPIGDYNNQFQLYVDRVKSEFKSGTLNDYIKSTDDSDFTNYLIARLKYLPENLEQTPENIIPILEEEVENYNKYGSFWNRTKLLDWYKAHAKETNVNIEDFNKPTPNYYKQGGLLNVIPEGALHARLNHLDLVNPEIADAVTNKGIPVITTENDGKIVQHAEIEHSEIIYNLEVSNKLEELRKLDKENESDDSYAIEAGKLITEETLRNTDDRMGLINNIE